MVKSEEGETERIPPSGGRLQKLCGSRHDTVSLVLETQALNTLYYDSNNDEMREAFVTANLALMEDFAPRDAIEAMLATQIIGTHNLTMKCQKLAAYADAPEKMGDYINMASKAGRSFNGLVETLDRHRGRKRPHVRVGPVNVSDGGQAIVSVVNKSAEAPPAREPASNRETIADEPGTSMRSAHPVPEAVSIIAGSGEDPLPDARRRSRQRGASRKPKCLEARPLHGGSDCDETGITRTDTPESAVDREPVSAADQELPTAEAYEEPCEWNSARVAGQAGPSYFPPVDLGWTYQHICDLRKRTRIRRKPISIADAAAAWYLDPESTETLDNIDALLAFGFIEQSGEGSERRIRITEPGLRGAEATDHEVRGQFLAEAALKPALIADYIERWGAARPEADVCISELKTAHGFKDKEAKAFLWVYDRTFHYVFEPEPHDPPDPLPQFAERRRGPDPAQDPWTKWLPDIEAFRDAA